MCPARRSAVPARVGGRCAVAQRATTSVRPSGAQHLRLAALIRDAVAVFMIFVCVGGGGENEWLAHARGRHELRQSLAQLVELVLAAALASELLPHRRRL